MKPVPIVALDVGDEARAFALVDRIGSELRWVKVGLQLFTAAGPDVVRRLRERGLNVFLDLKLHDIPNTVSGAVRAAAGIGADLLTVHAAGGEAMLHAAAEAAQANGPRLFAVTVLTSLAAEPNQVRGLADTALRAGIAGVVASVWDAPALRTAFGSKLALLCPGIRLVGGASHDQTRVATPEQATRAGVDYVVIGRAVSDEPDPGAAFQRVLAAL